MPLSPSPCNRLAANAGNVYRRRFSVAVVSPRDQVEKTRAAFHGRCVQFAQYLTTADCGTTFKIYLPRVDKPVEVIRRDKTPVRDTENVGTILLVENEERLQRSIGQILERAGYIVVPAPHGAGALRILEEHDGRIDLVLTDIGLPHMRGPELVEHLKSRRPNIAVLYMSGFGEDGLRPDEASELSGRFVQKPFRKDTLLRKLELTLARQS